MSCVCAIYGKTDARGEGGDSPCVHRFSSRPLKLKTSHELSKNVSYFSKGVRWRVLDTGFERGRSVFYKISLLNNDYDNIMFPVLAGIPPTNPIPILCFGISPYSRIWNVPAKVPELSPYSRAIVSVRCTVVPLDVCTAFRCAWYRVLGVVCTLCDLHVEPLFLLVDIQRDVIQCPCWS